MDPSAVAAEVRLLGLSKIEAILTDQEIAELIALVPEVRGGVRNFLKLPSVLELAQNPKLLKYVQSVLGLNAFPFRATFFDKHSDANWLVPWHQDLTIPVEQQLALPGWGPWSKKAGVLFVQPPAFVLQEILAVRIHLDSCTPSNGALQVLPNTHHLGRLTAEHIKDLRRQIPAHPCTINAGGIVLMRPMLLHASSKSSIEGHRRVIHFEYAAQQLPSHYPKLVAA